MMLYKIGSEKFFDMRLLILLMKKKNDEVKRILKEHRPSEWYPQETFSTAYHMRDCFQSTLLHYAAEYGNEEIVKYLIALGSEVDAEDNLRRTPLVLAVEGDHEMVIELLLKARANIKVDCRPKSALQKIPGFQSIRFKMIEKLLKQMTLQKIIEVGLGKNLRDAGFSLSRIADTKNVDLIELLLDQGYYPVDDRDSENGQTALHVAVEEQDLQLVQVLVQYGANVDALDNYKSIPLRYLYRYGRDDSGLGLEILKILLKTSRANLLTTCCISGVMQVHGVLSSGCNEAVKLILQRIDNLYVRDEMGDTIVHYLAKNYDVDVIEQLRDRQFDVNAFNDTGYTALHLAAERHLPRTIKFLLENEADVHIRGHTSDIPLRRLFWTLDAYPTIDESKKCIRLLLEYGSNALDRGVVKDSHLAISRLYGNLVRTPGRLEEAKDVLTVMEPMLAQWAISKVCGIDIDVYALSKIVTQPSWVEYFDKCERELDDTKATVVYGKVTLFDFLTERSKKILAYVRNKELVCELEKTIDRLEEDSAYSDSLRNRLVKANRLAELREIAIDTICRLADSGSNVYYFTAELIVEYLSNRDMINLKCALDP